MSGNPFELGEEDRAAMAEQEAAESVRDQDATRTERTERTEEPDAEPEPEQEQPIDDGSEPEARPDGKGRVPLDRFKEVNERNKALEKEVQKAREERARFDERLKLIQEAQQAQQARQAPQPEQPPDPNQDPLAAIAWTQKQLENQRQREAWHARQQQAQAQQAQQWDHVRTAVGQQFSEAVKERPEIMEAYNFLGEVLREEYKAHGYQGGQIDQALTSYESQIIAHAYNSNRPIGDYVESLAKSRGWKKSAPAQNGGDKIDRAVEGEARNRSLSKAGGSAAPTHMTVERLLAMSNDDFETWRTKNPNGFDKLMGA